MMNQGIGQFQNEAGRLAAFGRNGDMYIAHMSEGETVVPMEVFDENPQMRAMLFSQMRGMGLEPERYIVGNQLNSINPETGQPEFFFKKIFNGVKDVLKQAAPVLIPLAINFALPGATMGDAFIRSALSSGVGSLLSGADTEDALKSALIGGGIGAATRNLFPAAASEGTELQGGANVGTANTAAARSLTPAPSGDYLDDAVAPQSASSVSLKPNFEEPSFIKSVFNDPVPMGSDLVQTQEYADAVSGYMKGGIPKAEAQTKALADLTTKYTPSFIDKFGLPALAVSSLAFLPDEEVEEEERMSIQEYMDANYPSDYFDIDIGQRKPQGPFEVPPGIGFGAEGGDPMSFPRRTGPIGPGLGSGTKDDVPAMLMDGEFVFTKKAVNGAGGGDENKGMQRMYEIMRNFEAMA